MKSFSSLRSSCRSGFTLVELLVVIAIIAILAAVTLQVGGSIIKSAKRANASNTANQIQTAALNYYTEYSIYPIPSTAAASADLLISDTDTTMWPGMIYALCGNINPYNASTTAPGTVVPNTRAIAFLQLKSTDVDSNNCPLNPLKSGTSTYFNMAIDNDYDNIVGDSGTANQKLPDFVNTTSMAAPTYLTKGTTGGIAIWTNCNNSTTGTLPTQWIHTY